MNPYPFWSLNHFTVPVGMRNLPKRRTLYGRPPARTGQLITSSPPVSLWDGPGNKGEILKGGRRGVKKKLEKIQFD
jgi:hypothetical protein